MKRLEVWRVRLDPATGSEMRLLRPLGTLDAGTQAALLTCLAEMFVE